MVKKSKVYLQLMKEAGPAFVSEMRALGLSVRSPEAAKLRAALKDEEEEVGDNII